MKLPTWVLLFSVLCRFAQSVERFFLNAIMKRPMAATEASPHQTPFPPRRSGFLMVSRTLGMSPFSSSRLVAVPLEHNPTFAAQVLLPPSLPPSSARITPPPEILFSPFFRAISQPSRVQPLHEARILLPLPLKSHQLLDRPFDLHPQTGTLFLQFTFFFRFFYVWPPSGELPGRLSSLHPQAPVFFRVSS